MSNEVNDVSMSRIPDPVTYSDATLVGVPLFAGVPLETMRRLDTQCVWRRAQAGEWILDQRAGGNELYIVRRGHVRVVLETAAGREVILRDIKEGEYFGELAALDGQPRTAGIVAVTDTLVARMPAQVFRRTIHAHPEVCDKVLSTLVAQIRSLAQRADEQVGLTARQRLRAELLRLGRAPAGAGHAVISPPPTHAELAARIGSHREAVTRELNALARAGLIERRRGAIALLDADALRRSAE